MSRTAVALMALVTAFATSAWLTWRLSASPTFFSRMVDRPNERSLHAGALPRTGGIALCTALAAAYILALAAFSLPSSWAWTGGALLLVGGVSLLDDRGEVAARYRLAAHLGGGILLVAGGVSWSAIELPGIHRELPDTLSRLLTLGYLVWMVNLYNFMDGMDGFAGGMAVFGFGTMGWLGWQGGDPGFALANGIVVAAAAGFLLRNFPPARIFLGDLGSAILGLLAAIFSLVGARRGLFPLWVAWLAFSPFIVDATWTLLRRFVRGERVWEAHRSHHYQRLVLTGWSHRRTVLWSYLLMAACAATAVAARDVNARDQWFLLGAWTIIYLALGIRIRLAARAMDGTAP